MATYNKRGYKSPKPEVEKDPAFDTTVEDVNVNESESTTAGVFNTLDETANKTEASSFSVKAIGYPCLS